MVDMKGFLQMVFTGGFLFCIYLLLCFYIISFWHFDLVRILMLFVNYALMPIKNCIYKEHTNVFVTKTLQSLRKISFFFFSKF